MKKTLKNQYVYISFSDKTNNNPKAYISISDTTDYYNGQSAFTRKVRGIDKAWEFISQMMNDERLKDDLKFWDIVHILDDKFQLSTHCYCAID